MDSIYTELMKIFPQMNTVLVSGIYVFARIIGFFRLAPVFNKKEVPGMIKICLALLFTVIITPFVKPENMLGTQDSFILSILSLNVKSKFKISISSFSFVDFSKFVGL